MFRNNVKQLFSVQWVLRWRCYPDSGRWAHYCPPALSNECSLYFTSHLVGYQTTVLNIFSG
jgi:hypothetical protein